MVSLTSSWFLENDALFYKVEIKLTITIMSSDLLNDERTVTYIDCLKKEIRFYGNDTHAFLKELVVHLSVSLTFIKRS